MISEENPLRQSRYFELMVLCMALLISLAVMGIVSKGITPLLGINDLSEVFKNLSKDSSKDTIAAVRIIQMIGHIFVFLLPPILFLALINYKKPFHYLFLDRPPMIKNLVLGMIVILASMPLMQLVYWLNQQIPLPGTLQDMEEQSGGLIEVMLESNTTSGLLMNVFVIALLPALGEELLFRGVFQRIFSWLYKGPHAGIWVTAFLFSLIHMQFAGFFPRLFLGALLGYLLYWTGSLWVPIFAHFFYNGSQVIALYQYKKGAIKTNLENIEQFPLGITVFSVILLASLSWYLYHINKNQLKNYEERVEERL